jgi:SpoVK/Ycf46/Vps4 family AAA+-type ATPase
LARILAKNANKPFFEVKGDDLYAQQHEKREPRDKVLALLMDIEQGKFVGLKGGEQDINISNGYILFIDEANTMEKEAVPKGRKLGFLKTVYDAFDKHQENKKVLTILATNYLDDLDKGLFRVGRFPKLCFNFSLPLM